MIVKFRHSGNIGDIIYSIPCVKAMLKTIADQSRSGGPNFGSVPDEQVKAKWLLHTDIPANYIPGTLHPCGNVRMTAKFANAMREFLLRQSWVDSVEVAPFFHKKEIDVDLDEMRDINVSMDKGSIVDYYAWTFAVQYDNICDPWVQASDMMEDYSEYVIVSRSHRYRSPLIRYEFLSGCELVGFIGLDNEYDDFRRYCPQARRISLQSNRRSAYEIAASVIKSCRMFIGNQSFFYALAEALKVPRLLEVSPICPNVRQYGRYAYSALHENVMKDYFQVLLDVTEKSKEGVRLARTLADMFPAPEIYRGAPFNA
jgi:hypothetical protein